MYAFELTESYIAPQTDQDVLEITVGGLLRTIAAEHPDALALVEVTMEGNTDRRWTYRELLADSERLAQALASRFKPGERVTVWSPNTPEWVLMEYACALAGIVLVTANPAYQAKELRYVLEQSGAVGLFLVPSYRGNPMAQIAQTTTEGLTDVREIVNLDDTDALFHSTAEAVSLPEVKPGDAAQIQYTSGTTGFPKGAVLSHRGLVNNARFYAQRSKFNQQTVYANFMPMFHTSGCGMAVLGCLQAGCTMVLFKVFDPPAIIKQIESERITAFLGVPTMLVALVEVLEHTEADMSSLVMMTSGGSMVAPELVRNVSQAFGCEFQTLYGQTETSPSTHSTLC